MIPCGTWQAAHQSLRGVRKNGRVVNLYCPRAGGEVGRQRFVVGKSEVTSDYVLGRLLRKVGLRIGWGDEGRVGRRGRERALGDAFFGAQKHRAENGNEELAAFLSEGIAKRAVCGVGRDGLHRGDRQTGHVWSIWFRSDDKRKGWKVLVRLERVLGHRPRRCHLDVSFR